MMREYLAVMERRAGGLGPDDAAAALQWLEWSRRFVEASDPLANPIRMPDDPDMTDEVLSEFLSAWARGTYRSW